jgi:phosphate transport system substrate-binding protein
VQAKLHKVTFTVLLLISAALNAQPAQLPLRVAGASTIQPLALALAPAYEAGGRQLQIEGGGSGVGLSAVINRSADVGMVSRSLTAAEKLQVQYTSIGYDALVFVVNSGNPIDAVELPILRRIFLGEIKNWLEISTFDRPLITVNKEIGRSTLDLFEAYSGLNHPGRTRAGTSGTLSLELEIGSNLEMATIVGGLPGAIGYISLGTAEQLIAAGMPIKILRLDGVLANRQSILSGGYPIARELNLVFLQNNPAIDSFIKLFSGPEGLAQIQKAGFIPASQR